YGAQRKKVGSAVLSLHVSPALHSAPFFIGSQKRMCSTPPSAPRSHDGAHATLLYSNPSKTPQQYCSGHSDPSWHRTTASDVAWQVIAEPTHAYVVPLNGSWVAQQTLPMHDKSAPPSSVPHANGVTGLPASSGCASARTPPSPRPRQVSPPPIAS